jgi:FAD:protein FMN transferase
MPLFAYQFDAMASRNEIQLWDEDAARAQRASAAMIAEVRRIERKYSRYLDDSVTTTINRTAGAGTTSVDAETVALLRYADQCYRLSEGRFDLTSGVLCRVWDFRRHPARLPTDAELSAALALIGWNDVEWDERTLRLPRVGMEIDFGGIGKEYAADRAATICQEFRVANALVNLGGDVRAVGTQQGGMAWRVAIAHPRVEKATIASVELQGNAVATSGDYERYFELDGRRFCHLLNARTGWPVQLLQSVSVVAPLCVVAGSYATIAMLLEANGRAFLDAQRLTYLAVGSDGSLHSSKKIKHDAATPDAVG